MVCGIFILSSRHSGAMPTGLRRARPDDKLRIEPGISIDFHSIEIPDHFRFAECPE
jgi:hypothetical protein